MAKGDDVKARKKNKANRKKLAKDPSSVSARVAALIAAKKRRQSGKRRKCEGMCFSLPTPEDPFNDRYRKADTSTSKVEKPSCHSNEKGSLKDMGNRLPKASGDQDNTDHQTAKRLKRLESTNQQKVPIDNLDNRENAKLGRGKSQSLIKEMLPNDLGNSVCPSKFLFMCLNTIQDSLLGDGKINKELNEPVFVKSWGVDLWKSYSLGHDILENSGTDSSIQQIAWMASTATDKISQLEKEGISFNSPFLLYLVSSQEKAVKVRSVCKPLKTFGVHTVILHPGTSVEQQVHGLKSCEPEFLVATPERLWELISLNAVDVSGASFLVVDGIDSLSHCLDVVKCIKDSISGNPCTVVFQGSLSGSSVQTVQKSLRKPFQKLSLVESIKSQGLQL